MKAKFDSEQTLAGKYVINRPIGAGGFAKVYEATDLKVGRRVAIKVLSTSFEEVVERFAREISAIKELEHPNIVRLYDFDQTPDGAPFMVMEYVEGVELGELVEREGKLPLRRAIHLGMQVADALAEAHAKGVVHCDLKPENILLSAKGARDDVVHVLDFGIAALTRPGVVDTDSSKPESLAGTPSYMSPEQIRQKNVGPWTDVYALGLILIEMVSGVCVYDGTSAHEILTRQIKEPVRFPPELNGTPLFPIVERCVQKDYTLRYANAREVFVALEVAANELAASNRSGETKMPDFDPFASRRSEEQLPSGPLEFSNQMGNDGSVSGRDASLDEVVPVKRQGIGRIGPGTRKPAPEEDKYSDTVRIRMSDDKLTETTRLRLNEEIRAKALELDRKKSAEPFKVSLDKDALQRIEEKRRAARVYQPERKAGAGKWLVLVAVLVLVGAAVGAYFVTRPKDATDNTAAPAEGADIPTPKPPKPVSNAPVTKFDTTALREQMRIGSATSSIGAIAKQARCFKLIVSPFNVQISVGIRRICERSPCDFIVVGPKAVAVISARGFKDERVELQPATAKEDSIMIELKAE